MSTVIPHGSTVLVTGAAGLVGAGVSYELIKAGYKVRGAARTLAKVEPLKKRFDTEFGPGKFEIAHVPDYGVAGAYDEAVKGVAGVAHVAADVSFLPDPDVVIKGTIAGLHNILQAAAASPTVVRFVITSSRIAVFHPRPDDDYRVDNDSYLDAFVKMAYDAPADDPARPVLSYTAGKVEGEKAAWQWVKEHKPNFVLNTVLPDLVFGEIINPRSRSGPFESSTAGRLNAIFTSSDPQYFMPFAEWPAFYVDVHDVGRVHLAALIEEDVKNERLWALAYPFTLNQILDIWRKEFPNRKLPPNYPGLDVPTKITVDNSRSTELLKRQGRSDWVGLKEILIAQVEGL